MEVIKGGAGDFLAGTLFQLSDLEIGVFDQLCQDFIRLLLGGNLNLFGFSTVKYRRELLAAALAE